MESYGKIAYDAYCQTVNWKFVLTGESLPEWDDVNCEIAQAWENAAHAVATVVGQSAE